ncbi:MAG TPA: hypothetical protein V6C89_02290 [Drouetiella sp.]|jgi:hypothetical protein
MNRTARMLGALALASIVGNSAGCLTEAAFAQTASNNSGTSSSFGANRGFSSYTFRNPQSFNTPTFPNPASPLLYPTVRGGTGAFANQINNTPNTNIQSYSGTNGLNAQGKSISTINLQGLSNNSLNLTPLSQSTSNVTTNPASNNPGFNNQGTATNNTTGIINQGSGLR